MGCFVKCVVTLAMVCVLSLKGFAQDDKKKAQTALPFLTIAPDARASGMGDTGVATEADINSQYWNPAKYAFILPDYGLSISYTPWLQKISDDIKLLYFSGYARFAQRHMVSFSLHTFSMGDIPFVWDEYSVPVNRSATDFSVDLAYTLHMSPTLSGGVTFRYINASVAEKNSAIVTTNNFAADLNFYFQKPVSLGKEEESIVAAGFQLSNMGPKVTYSENVSYYLPTNLKLGGRFTYTFNALHSLSLGLDFDKPLSPYYEGDNTSALSAMFSSFSDESFSNEMKDIAISTGLEYNYAKQFFMRGGYHYANKKYGNKRYLTFGAGVRYKALVFDVSYLYNVTEYNFALDNIFRFSLGIYFGTNEKKGIADIFD